MIQLRQLYLQLPLVGTRAPGEDIQDQTYPIHYPRGAGSLQVALLNRGQRTVEEEKIDIIGTHEIGNLLHLATTNTGGRIQTRAGNRPQRKNDRAGICCQLAKFLATILRCSWASDVYE
jgi:hypothetical protein